MENNKSSANSPRTQTELTASLCRAYRAYMEELVKPLKEACDRNWKDENPAQIVAIAANTIHWRRIAPAAQAVIEYVRRHHNSRSDKLMQMIQHYDEAYLAWAELSGDSPRPQESLMATVERTSAGPILKVLGINVRAWLGCAYDVIADELASNINAKRAELREAEAPSQQEVYRKALEAIANDPIIGNEVLDPAALMYRGIAKRALEAEAPHQPAQEDLARLLSVCRDYMDGKYDDGSGRLMTLFSEDLFSALKSF